MNTTDNKAALLQEILDKGRVSAAAYIHLWNEAKAMQAQRDAAVAALRELLQWAPRATPPRRMDKMDTNCHYLAEQGAWAAIAAAEKGQ